MPTYDPKNIEPKWQQYWEKNETFRAHEDPEKPKIYILDMFPYPSGEGLHVGHPEGYTATDIYSRYKRMCGFNVLHPIGYDSFGLPAEQFAIRTGTHPRITTERNISIIREQMKKLGLSYDWSRELATTDPGYVRWTQWIFLVLYETWFDPDLEWTDPDGEIRRGKGRPIGELPVPEGVRLEGEGAVHRYQDRFRLAYQAESPVNWCPGLGTVLADEEVINGRSERGDFPVRRIALRQWMLRITAYADRLVEDLEKLAWPTSIQEMQRNWVGRSEGAEVDFFAHPPGAAFDAWLQQRSQTGFPEEPDPEAIRVYTTRPDTLFGATYMVLAPEHALVDRVTTEDHLEEIEEYRREVAAMSEEDRIAGRGEKSGVFTGGYATNPVNGEKIPIWVAEYVLMGYGTGAIMAVPGHDERDFEFARKFGLPIRAVVMPPEDWLSRMQASPQDYAGRIAGLEEAFIGGGFGIQSENREISLNGIPSDQAMARITDWLQAAGIGLGAVKYKLRDWLFSRQRYWGEPIPVIHELDSEGKLTGLTHPIAEKELPLLIPELDDYQPTGRPTGPLEKATDWLRVRKDGKDWLRETNTMPQWAGSCWYYLRFCDPDNEAAAWDLRKERYWMPVDLYVGGAEHAVLHLLYARFWHKVLFDRGYTSTLEPFRRLVNQGMILSITYRNKEGRIIPYAKIEFADARATSSETGEELDGEVEKMSKARGNVISVDVPLRQYGADTTRLYEMFMGPVEDTKPWSMKGVAGVSRFLGRSWRMIVDEFKEATGISEKVSSAAYPTREQLRVMHRTIQAVTNDIEGLRFNTAISRLMEFVNFFTGQETRPVLCMKNFVLMLAPFAPHIAEELWNTLGHDETLAYTPWPESDETYTREEIITIPIQINGTLRAHLQVPADASMKEVESAALADPKIQKYVEGKTIRKVIVVPKKIVNIVIA